MILNKRIELFISEFQFHSFCVISNRKTRELQILRRRRDFPNSKQCARTNVILAGKCGWRRQSTYSTTSFQLECRSGKNELSNVRNYIIQRSGEGLTSFNGDKRANFCGEKKYIEAFRGVYFRKQARKPKIKCRLRIVLVLESKALHFQTKTIQNHNLNSLTTSYVTHCICKNEANRCYRFQVRNRGRVNFTIIRMILPVINFCSSVDV